jgi:hypothetical protein
MSSLPVTTPEREARMRELYRQLQPGNRVEVEHTVMIGPRTWTKKTEGTVVGKSRMRHGLHFARNFDDKVFSDTLVLQQSDGELTTVTVDEFTSLRRL